MVVVVGPHVHELVPLAERAGADVCLLPEETPDMRATVEHGLLWLEDRFDPRPDDAWLLAPADHPTLDVDVVRELCNRYARQLGQTILIPTYEGRRGHPTLIEWRHVDGIRAMPVREGLNSYLRTHTVETLELPVSSAGVLWDLDTPEDYERAKSRLALFSSGT